MKVINIAILAIVLLTNNLYSQENNDTIRTISSRLTDAALAGSPLTAREVYTDAKEGFQQLVLSLQGPSKHIYEVYTKQFFYSALGYTILTAFTLIYSLILINLMIIRLNKDEMKDIDDLKASHQISAVAGIVLLIASVILVIVFFCSSYFSQLCNPEYFAIDKIATTLHPPITSQTP